jgi:hypothetical protein
MYPIEHQLCTFKNTIRSRARAEACIAEAYIAWEASTYCKRYLVDIDPTSNHGHDQYQDDINKAGGCVFKHRVKLLGKKDHRTLGEAEYEQLSWYVLHNTEEVDKFYE